MAVHLPLSTEAQREAKMLMLASGNLLKPSDGEPVTVPTQDMILGSYYLTMVNPEDPGHDKVFRDEDEALMAYAEHIVTLQAPVKVRRTMDFGNGPETALVTTTVGKIIFNTPSRRIWAMWIAPTPNISSITKSISRSPRRSCPTSSAAA